MKVLFFSDTLPPITDGVSHTLSRLVQTLQSSDVEFRFVSAWKPDDSVKWSQHVRRVPSIAFGLYNYYRMGMPYLQRLGKELDSFSPDLVHVVSPTPLGVWGAGYARSRCLPAVTSYHTHFVSYLPYYRLTKLTGVAWSILRWFHNKFEVTYAPSPSARDELSRQGICGIQLWPRGIDAQQFSPLHRSEQLRAEYGVNSKPLLIFVGRLVKEKDLDVLVDACAALEKEGREFDVALIGDGPMRTEIKSRLPRAILPGFQRGNDLSRWYASAEIFVFPSTTETFGNVVLEAGASGLPVVCAEAGGVADLVTHEHTGLLARPHSADDFAAKLDLLLQSSDLRQRMGSNGREFAMSHDWHAVNKLLLESYENTIAEWGKPRNGSRRPHCPRWDAAPPRR